MTLRDTSPVYLAPDGQQLHVGNGGTASVDAGGAVEIKSGAVATVEAGGTVTVENGGAVDFQAGTVFTPHAVALTEDTALTAAQSGTLFYVDAADIVATLPATVAGLVYHFAIRVVSAVTGFSVSPAPADNINAGADDKDIINTQGTDLVTDCLTVVGDGVTGWTVTSKGGIWAMED